VGGGSAGAAGSANLTAQVASSLIWSSCPPALVVANLAYTATITRLLEPTAFGLVAMANLVGLCVWVIAAAVAAAEVPRYLGWTTILANAGSPSFRQ